MTPEQAGSRDPSSSNREAWLQRAAVELKSWLEDVSDVTVPAIWVSIGFPGGRSMNKVVGQCWSRGASQDGINHIFVSPVRGSDQSVDVLATLLHEMIHAADDCKSAHRGNFARIARAVGFVPSFTTATNRSDELTERLEGLVERLGALPHGAITGQRAASGPAKQSTRMIKLVAVECCEYLVRTSRKWIDEVGYPQCPHGGEMVES